MRFKATDVYDYFKPSECVRRVALRARGEEEQDTDTAFGELLRNLGHLHEESHLATLAGLVDLAELDPAERERATLQAIRASAPAIYQPRFRLELPLDGETLELVGEPDFLIRDAARGGYKIRDSKLARNVFSPRHRGIPAQLQIYGFLFERVVGKRPTELEVHAGDDDIVAVAYEGEKAVLETLRDHLAMRAADPAAYEPIGWTKCAGCGFEDRCRAEAEARQDPALLYRVNQNRAREFHRLGIRTIADIPKAVDDPALRDYFWTGERKPRPKDFVAPLLRSAEAWISKPIRLDDAPELPTARNFAMLDLEGLPPYADELDRIYLWGVKVFGEKPSAYLPAQSGFGADGDCEGWFAFLELAARLFTEYGPDLPFVHWGPREDPHHRIRQPLRRPLLPLSRRERVGVRVAGVGIAARLLSNLVDLLTVVRNSVSSRFRATPSRWSKLRRLPSPHTSANGTWSIAKYIEATETNDPAARAAIVSQILAYNEEDLDATWAVLKWLEKQR